MTATTRSVKTRASSSWVGDYFATLATALAAATPLTRRAFAQTNHNDKALYEAARSEGELTWYSAHYTSETSERIGRAFTAKYAGIKFEDQTTPPNRKGRPLIPAEAMVEKLATAVDARGDESFLLMARTDAAPTSGHYGVLSFQRAVRH